MTRTIVAALLLFLLAALAWADGGIFPRAAAVKPARTPDQRALVAFDGKTETLVVETTVEGEGSEFAWVLPLPAAPRIEASTTGTFPTLEVVCGPRVWTRTNLVPLLFVLPLGALVWYGAVRRWGVGGFIAAWFVVGGVTTTVAVTVPKMQGEPGASAAGVREISREVVGAFDTATLAATDAASLRRWLGGHGFRAPAEIDPVIDDYARAGWVFVASKIRRDADDGAVRRVHPLAFTFPAAEAVYPMRLTGAVNDSLALELFVLGDRRAEADGLSVEFCDGNVEWMLAAESGSWVPHEELRRRAPGAQVVTKLTGVLDRAAMSRDVAPRWTDFRRTQTTYVTNHVALVESGAAGAGAFGLVLIVAAIRRRRSRANPAPSGAVSTLRDVAVATATAALVFGVAWLLAPRLPQGAHEIGREPGHPWLAESRAPIHDLAAARAWVSAATAGRLNPFTDEPIREEDSPGNYTLREQGDGVRLVVYDSFYGQIEVQEIDLSSGAPPRVR